MRYALGPLTVDADRLVITAGDRPLDIPPKVVELVSALCEHSGEFVSKDDLRRRLWPADGADDSVLWQKVYLARKGLSPVFGPNVIENLPRRGYRLTAPVLREDASPPRTMPATQQARRRGQRWITAAGLGICLALFGGVQLVRTPGGAGLDSGAERSYRLGAYFLSLRTADGARKAERCFRRVASSSKSATAALGYAGLANAYVVLAGERGGPYGDAELRTARASAQWALRLDPASSASAGALGTVLFARDVRESRDKSLREDPAARAAFVRALALDAGNASAQLQYGEYLLFRGDLRSAVDHLAAAIDADPSSAIANVWLAEASYENGDARSAETYASRAIAFGTSDQEDALTLIGLARDRRRDTDHALAAFGALERYAAAHANVLRAYLAAEHGSRGEAGRLLELALRQRTCNCGRFWLDVALTQSLLGNRSAAVVSVRRMGRTLRGEAQILLLDPRVAMLRRDPRLRGVLRESFGA